MEIKVGVKHASCKQHKLLTLVYLNILVGKNTGQPYFHEVPQKGVTSVFYEECLSVHSSNSYLMICSALYILSDFMQYLLGNIVSVLNTAFSNINSNSCTFFQSSQ